MLQFFIGNFLGGTYGRLLVTACWSLCVMGSGVRNQVTPYIYTQWYTFVPAWYFLTWGATNIQKIGGGNYDSAPFLLGLQQISRFFCWDYTSLLKLVQNSLPRVVGCPFPEDMVRTFTFEEPSSFERKSQKRKQIWTCSDFASSPFMQCATWNISI